MAKIGADTWICLFFFGLVFSQVFDLCVMLLLHFLGRWIAFSGLFDCNRCILFSLESLFTLWYLSSHTIMTLHIPNPRTESWNSGTSDFFVYILPSYHIIYSLRQKWNRKTNLGLKKISLYTFLKEIPRVCHKRWGNCLPNLSIKSGYSLEE